MNVKKISRRVIRVDLRSPAADLLNRPIMDGLPASIFADICEHFPGYKKSESALEIDRPLNHPDLQEFLDFARHAGAIIPCNRSENPSQLQIRDYIIYSLDDSLTAQYLECEVTEPFFEGISMADKLENVSISTRLARRLKAANEQLFGSIGNLYHILAVRGVAKLHLERADLKHLQLIPIATDTPNGQWPDGAEPLYLVWSDYELPPVSMPLFDRLGNMYLKGEPRLPKVRGGYYILDGYDINPPLGYEQLPIDAFDVARSFERFGGEKECYCKLVYSQRARKVLEEIGMELELRPVKLG